MNWRRALRDWRVWALVFTIQGSGVRAIAGYAPAPLFVLVFVFIAAFVFYSACRQAAGYVEVAVRALVASVAMHAARHAPETP